MTKAEKIVLTLVSYLTITISSKSSYIAFFKGGIFLVSFYLISCQYMLSSFLQVDISTKKLKHSVEISQNKSYESISDMSCDIKLNSYIDCNLAKYQSRLIDRSYSVLEDLWPYIIGFASMFLLLSFVGFILHPFYHDEEKYKPRDKNITKQSR